MIIDPHIAFMRTSAPLDFFDRVMMRVVAREESPRGILLQCSAMAEGGVNVLTVYRDRASQLETFANFVAVEAQNEMVATGESYDISRQDHELQRLRISSNAPAQEFGGAPAKGVAAGVTELRALSPTSYHALLEAAGWFDRPAPGRIAHAAWATDDRVVAVDFWTSREVGQEWYQAQRLEDFEAAHPDVEAPSQRRSWWSELHSFDIVADPEDEMRDYTRHAIGPTDTAAGS